MAKDPAILFYTADFLIGTSFFTSAETGDYIRVLCHMHHMGGHMGSQDILKVAPNITENVFKKFETTPEGLYFNARLLMEIDKRKAFTASRLKNLKGSHVAPHMGSHMENENRNENVLLKKGIVKGKQELPSDEPITHSFQAQEIKLFFKDRGAPEAEADKFWNHFESLGWMVGGTRITNWRPKAQNWIIGIKKEPEAKKIRSETPRRDDWKPPPESECAPPPKEFLDLANSIGKPIP